MCSRTAPTTRGSVITASTRIAEMNFGHPPSEDGDEFWMSFGHPPSEDVGCPETHHVGERDVEVVDGCRERHGSSLGEEAGRQGGGAADPACNDKHPAPSPDERFATTRALPVGDGPDRCRRSSGASKQANGRQAMSGGVRAGRECGVAGPETHDGGQQTGCNVSRPAPHLLRWRRWCLTDG